jgi:hypothetical protein
VWVGSARRDRPKSPGVPGSPKVQKCEVGLFVESFIKDITCGGEPDTDVGMSPFMGTAAPTTPTTISSRQAIIIQQVISEREEVLDIIGTSGGLVLSGAVLPRGFRSEGISEGVQQNFSRNVHRSYNVSYKVVVVVVVFISIGGKKEKFVMRMEAEDCSPCLVIPCARRP